MPEPAALLPGAAPIPEAGEDTLYEVVDGRRVEKPPMGAYEVHIATVLVIALGSFGRERGLGRAECEMLFALGPGVPQRRPDVAFVSFGRWPRDRRVPDAAAWAVVPDLAVEVVSPTNTADEIMTKLHEYFEAGVRLVWVVYPRQAVVYAYDAPANPRGLTRADALDGGGVLPGFRLPLADLFGEEAGDA